MKVYDKINLGEEIMKQLLNKNKLNNKGFEMKELIIIVTILGIIIIIGIIIGSIISNSNKSKIDNGIFVINYNANGGTGEMDNTECKKNNECLLKNNTFYKEGYDFIGWAKSAEDEEPTYKINDVYLANSDVTLYAVWKIKEITIVYDPNGGTGEMEETIYAYSDSEVEIQENKFEKKGYTFNNWHIYNEILDKWYGCTDENTTCNGKEKESTLGWYKREEIKAYYDNPTEWNGLNSEYDLIYYAQWGESTYEIKYELNGGIIGEDAPVSGVSGSTVTVSNPTKEGYTFKDWTITGTDATIKDSELTIGTSDIILTANWIEDSITNIQYLYNAGNDNSILTGGWLASKKLNQSQNATQSGKITLNSNNMVASVKYEAKKRQAVGFIRANNKIDVTEYSKLYIRCAYQTNHSDVTTTFGLFKNDIIPNYSGIATQHLGVTTSEKLYIIDISDITGSYYLGFYIGDRNHPAEASLTITEIYLS